MTRHRCPVCPAAYRWPLDLWEHLYRAGHRLTAVAGDPFDDAVAVDPNTFDPNDTALRSRVAGAIARSIADAAATVQNCTVTDPARTPEQRVRDLAALLDAAVARHGIEWLVGRPPP